jgi:hypothetical protein
MEDPSLPQELLAEINALTGESFAGLDLLLRLNAAQAESFERWATSTRWHRFHDEHYDWWSFPIDEPSLRFGPAFKLSDGDVANLLTEGEFTKRLDRSIELVSASLGWNLAETRLDENVEEMRRYDESEFGNHGMRLRKMLLAATLFRRETALRSLSSFARVLRDAGRLEAPQFFAPFLAD